MKRFAMMTGLLLLAAAPASAQVGFGPQVSWADDMDLGVGARFTFPLTQVASPEEDSPLSDMLIIGSFDWFFPNDDTADVDVSYLEINANLAYPLELEELDPYVGAGVNVARFSLSSDVAGVPDTSDTEIGVNLLAGLNFFLGSFDAFTEARLELGGGEQFVLTAGLLFGGQ
ncbi:MAG TPA: hypothetical protein VK966_05450 [Longimicrobiales bacterium]|nr:hypothetical protein [Longimicrobiales bacterium]